MKLYVGNLPWSASEEEVREMFAAIGETHSVSLITERDTGRSRGFAFVEMSKESAERAISELNGKDLGGRPLRINEALDRPRRGAGGGGGGGDRRY